MKIDWRVYAKIRDAFASSYDATMSKAIARCTSSALLRLQARDVDFGRDVWTEAERVNYARLAR